MRRGSSQLAVSFVFSPGTPARGTFTAGDLSAIGRSACERAIRAVGSLGIAH